MSIAAILAQLFALLASHVNLIQTALGFILADDWSGLEAWIESLVVSPTPPVDVNSLKGIAAKLKATGKKSFRTA